ncbi:MAG: glycosyltransferase [Ferruginibacter sp.]|nr:glycosyltransferase [Ferruginibacter sp.]
MKKVLFILDNLEGGGAERVFVNIANGFVKEHIDVEFLLGKRQGIYQGILDKSIPVHEVGGMSLLKYIRFFPAFFRQHKYTHIFTASHYPAAAAILAKKMSSVNAKIYQTHHFSHPPRRELKYLKGDLLLKAIYFFLTPAAHKIIAVSKGSLSWLRRFSHRSLRQAMHIYNPVFDESIYEKAKEPLTMPVSTEGRTILLNIGRLSEQKDQLTLIKAFQLYLKYDPQAILFIVGTGPLQSQLESYIKTYELQKEVILAGFQDNPYNWILACDVFVLSSKYEGFGNVIVEAMALGKTVVSTDCPSGPAEILEDGRLGFLCPVGEPVLLAEAIRKGVTCQLDSTLLGEVSKQYMTPAIIQQYIAVL